MIKNKRAVTIGAAGIAALLILIFGISWLKRIDLLNPSIYYYARFDRVNGLTKSGPVFVDGFQVGSVRNIVYDYEHPGKVIVQTQLDGNLKLPRGSRAEIEEKLLGEVQVNLLLAPDRGEYLKIGDTISGGIKRGMTDSVAEFMPQVKVLLAKVDSVLTTMNRVLNSSEVDGTLKSLHRTADNMAVVSAEMKTLVSTEIPRLTNSIGQAGENINLLAQKLNGIDYEGMSKRVDRTLANVQQVTDKLNSTNNSMGLLLNDDTLYRNLNYAVDRAGLLMHDLQANPKRYVHFSVFGRSNKGGSVALPQKPYPLPTDSLKH